MDYVVLPTLASRLLAIAVISRYLVGHILFLSRPAGLQARKFYYRRCAGSSTCQSYSGSASMFDCCHTFNCAPTK